MKNPSIEETVLPGSFEQNQSTGVENPVMNQQVISGVMGQGIQPSGCGDPPQLVYALGKIDYDITTETRGHSLKAAGIKNPSDPQEFLDHLKQNPFNATTVTWIIKQEETPLYAILPVGPYAAETYLKLADFLGQELKTDVDEVSIPGYLTGSTVILHNQQEVRMIVPEIRGMYCWSTPGLVKNILGDSPTKEKEKAEYDKKNEDIKNFLDRVYYEIRNPGVTPQERALNHAATNAYQLGEIFTETCKGDLKLDSIGVEKSPSCPPGSDCWDVKLIFFHPLKRLEKAKDVFRFTVDVSDVVPVVMGKIRHWQQH